MKELFEKYDQMRTKLIQMRSAEDIKKEYVFFIAHLLERAVKVQKSVKEIMLQAGELAAYTGSEAIELSERLSSARLALDNTPALPEIPSDEEWKTAYLAVDRCYEAVKAVTCAAQIAIATMGANTPFNLENLEKRLKTVTDGIERASAEMSKVIFQEGNTSDHCRGAMQAVLDFEIPVALTEAGRHKSRGEWHWERSSGYSGYRCHKCSDWVYEGDPKLCQCDLQ